MATPKRPLTRTTSIIEIDSSSSSPSSPSPEPALVPERALAPSTSALSGASGSNPPSTPQHKPNSHAQQKPSSQQLPVPPTPKNQRRTRSQGPASSPRVLSASTSTSSKGSRITPVANATSATTANPRAHPNTNTNISPSTHVNATSASTNANANVKGKQKLLYPVIEISDSDSDSEPPARLAPPLTPNSSRSQALRASQAPKFSQDKGKGKELAVTTVASASRVLHLDVEEKTNPKAKIEQMEIEVETEEDDVDEVVLVVAKAEEKTATKTEPVETDDADDTDDEVELVDYDPVFAAKRFPFDEEFMASQSLTQSQKSSGSGSQSKSAPAVASPPKTTPALKHASQSRTPRETPRSQMPATAGPSRLPHSHPPRTFLAPYKQARTPLQTPSKPPPAFATPTRAPPTFGVTAGPSGARARTHTPRLLAELDFALLNRDGDKGDGKGRDKEENGADVRTDEADKGDGDKGAGATPKHEDANKNDAFKDPPNALGPVPLQPILAAANFNAPAPQDPPAMRLFQRDELPPPAARLLQFFYPAAGDDDQPHAGAPVQPIQAEAVQQVQQAQQAQQAQQVQPLAAPVQPLQRAEAREHDPYAPAQLAAQALQLAHQAVRPLPPLQPLPLLQPLPALQPLPPIQPVQLAPLPPPVVQPPAQHPAAAKPQANIAPAVNEIEAHTALALAQIREVLPTLDMAYVERVVRANVALFGAETGERVLGALVEGQVVVPDAPAVPVVQAPAQVPVPPALQVNAAAGPAPPAPGPAAAAVGGAAQGGQGQAVHGGQDGGGVEAQIATATAQVLQVFPDIERAYLARRVREFANAGAGVETGARVIEALVEGGGEWPKEPRQKEQNKDAGGKGKGRAVDAGAEEQGAAKRTRVDYERIDRPFEGGTHYVSMALIHLQCAFPYTPKSHLRRVLTSHNQHYAPAYIYLSTGAFPPGVAWASWRRSAPGHPRTPHPGADANGFLKGAEWDPGWAPNKTKFDRRRREALLAGRRDEVLEDERRWVEGRFGGVDGEEGVDKGKGKEMEVEQVEEEEGGDIECQCCFCEYSFSQMVQCPEAHLFCITCVKTYASNQLAASNASLVCMHSSGCALPFPASELSRALPEKLMELYERVLAAKAVEAAGLEGLEACPFCDWQCVMEVGGEEKLFRCGNVDRCGAVSCRTCKKKDHLPKSCEEFEADKNLDGRHRIEEAMTAALMRNCPKCKKAFIKEHGCNKMTCPNCRTLSCYVCRKAITGYDHFNQNQPNQPAAASSSTNKKCLLWDEVEKRHADDVRAAAEAATRAVREANPELDEEKIRVEVPKVPVPPAQPAIARQGAGVFGGLAGGAWDVFGAGGGMLPNPYLGAMPYNRLDHLHRNLAHVDRLNHHRNEALRGRGRFEEEEHWEDMAEEDWAALPLGEERVVYNYEARYVYPGPAGARGGGVAALAGGMAANVAPAAAPAAAAPIPPAGAPGAAGGAGRQARRAARAARAVNAQAAQVVQAAAAQAPRRRPAPPAREQVVYFPAAPVPAPAPAIAPLHIAAPRAAGGRVRAHAHVQPPAQLQPHAQVQVPAQVPAQANDQAPYFPGLLAQVQAQAEAMQAQVQQMMRGAQGAPAAQDQARALPVFDPERNSQVPAQVPAQANDQAPYFPGLLAQVQAQAEAMQAQVQQMMRGAQGAPAAQDQARALPVFDPERNRAAVAAKRARILAGPRAEVRWADDVAAIAQMPNAAAEERQAEALDAQVQQMRAQVRAQHEAQAQAAPAERHLLAQGRQRAAAVAVMEDRHRRAHEAALLAARREEHRERKAAKRRREEATRAQALALEAERDLGRAMAAVEMEMRRGPVAGGSGAGRAEAGAREGGSKEEGSARKKARKG